LTGAEGRIILRIVVEGGLRWASGGASGHRRRAGIAPTASLPAATIGQLARPSGMGRPASARSPSLTASRAASRRHRPARRPMARAACPCAS